VGKELIRKTREYERGLLDYRKCSMFILCAMWEEEE
jgi:hypothetical protein